MCLDEVWITWINIRYKLASGHENKLLHAHKLRRDLAEPGNSLQTTRKVRYSLDSICSNNSNWIWWSNKKPEIAWEVYWVIGSHNNNCSKQKSKVSDVTFYQESCYDQHRHQQQLQILVVQLQSLTYPTPYVQLTPLHRSDWDLDALLQSLPAHIKWYTQQSMEQNQYNTGISLTMLSQTRTYACRKKKNTQKLCKNEIKYLGHAVQ